MFTRVFTALAVVAALVAGPAAAAKDEPRLALVIGNAAYDFPGWSLAQPVADAEAMADALSDVGFDVELVVNATETDLEAAVRRLRTRLYEAGPDAVAFFYYSGHAAQSEDANWLIPVDFDGEYLQDIYQDSSELNTVLEFMDTADNNRNFIVLDASRNNALSSLDDSVARPGLAAVTPPPGALVAYADAPGLSNAASGFSMGALSPFTAALVDALDDPMPAGDVFWSVSKSVSQSTNGRQVPWFRETPGPTSSTPFYFARDLQVAAAEPDDVADAADPDTVPVRLRLRVDLGAIYRDSRLGSALTQALWGLQFDMRDELNAAIDPRQFEYDRRQLMLRTRGMSANQVLAEPQLAALWESVEERARLKREMEARFAAEFSATEQAGRDAIAAEIEKVFIDIRDEREAQNLRQAADAPQMTLSEDITVELIRRLNASGVILQFERVRLEDITEPVFIDE